MKGGHRVYGRRWLVLVAVTLLNLANYSHWISFAAVAKHAAQFYRVSGPEVKDILKYFAESYSAADEYVVLWFPTEIIMKGIFNFMHRRNNFV